MSASSDPAASVPPVVRWYARYCQAGVALFVVASFVGVYFVFARDRLAITMEVEPAVVAIFGGLWSLTLLFLASVHLAALKTPPADRPRKMSASTIASASERCAVSRAKNALCSSISTVRPA